MIESSEAIEAWIIDVTGFPKKGRHSVGVTRQYCGQLGEQNNCPIAVSLSLANHDASLPVAYQLYLPEECASDRNRRDKAKVPETVAFQTKPEIALEQIKAAYAAGSSRGVVCKFRSFRRAISVQTGRRFRSKLTGRFGPKRHPTRRRFRYWPRRPLLQD